MQDEDILSEWMEAYGDVVLRNAYLLLRDIHLAEDITQEAFLTAFEKRHQLIDKTKVRAWIIQIASNLCRQRLRRAARKRLSFREKPEDSDVHEGITGRTSSSDLISSFGPKGFAEAVVTHQTLTESIMQLPYKYREVVVLHYYQARSIEEIANLLGGSIGTVKSRLSRARSALRQLLGEEDWLNG